MRHFEPIMMSEILRDAENLRHNNNWDMVHCMRRRELCSIAGVCRIVECRTGETFPNPGDKLL